MRLRAGSLASIVVLLLATSPASAQPTDPTAADPAQPTDPAAAEQPSDQGAPDPADPADQAASEPVEAPQVVPSESPTEPIPPAAYPPADRPSEGLPYPDGIVVVEAPYAPPPPPPAMERRTGLMVVGIVLTGLGAISTITGAALVGEVEERNDCQDNQLLRCAMPAADRRQRDAGIAVGMVGLGLIGVGIPLTVVGARKRPVTPEISLRLTPTAGRLRVRF